MLPATGGSDNGWRRRLPHPGHRNAGQGRQQAHQAGHAHDRHHPGNAVPAPSQSLETATSSRYSQTRSTRSPSNGQRGGGDDPFVLSECPQPSQQFRPGDRVSGGHRAERRHLLSGCGAGREQLFPRAYWKRGLTIQPDHGPRGRRMTGRYRPPRSRRASAGRSGSPAGARMSRQACRWPAAGEKRQGGDRAPRHQDRPRTGARKGVPAPA
jgi:hypothetical protein